MNKLMSDGKSAPAREIMDRVFNRGLFEFNNN